MKLLKTAPLLLSICLVLMACSEDQSINRVQFNARGLTAPFSFVEHSEACNSDNPYDAIGIYHNAVLQYFASYCELNGWPDITELEDVLSTVSYEFLSENYILLDADSVAYDYSIVWPLDSFRVHTHKCLVDDFDWEDSVYTPLFTLNATNSDVVDFWLDVIDVLHDTTITDKYTSIRSLESSVIAITDTNQVASRGLKLIFSSVARHSYAYWSDTLTRPPWPREIYPDGSHIYLEYGDEPKDSPSKKSDKLSDIGTTDAVGLASGAVGGFFAGGLGGFLSGATLPGGEVLLGGAGAAWGAISGSATYGLGNAITMSVADLFAGGAGGRMIKKTIKAVKEDKKK